MKSFWALFLVTVFMTACSGGGGNTADQGGNDPSGGSEPQDTGYPCERVSDLSRCSADFKALEVSQWFNFLELYLDEPLSFSLGDSEETKAFECGAHMDQSAQRFLNSASYQQAKDHIFEMYELFVDPENCAHKPNIDELFREVLQQQ